MPNLRARQLRNHPTDAESLLWQHLRRSQILGRKFRRQEPIGPYIVDFACFDPMLVIEIDGSQHAESIAHDAERFAEIDEAVLGVSLRERLAVPARGDGGVAERRLELPGVDVASLHPGHGGSSLCP